MWHTHFSRRFFSLLFLFSTVSFPRCRLILLIKVFDLITRSHGSECNEVENVAQAVDDESGESMKPTEEVPLKELGESELERLVRG